MPPLLGGGLRTATGYIRATVMHGDAGMKRVSKGTKFMALIVALVMSAFAAWSNFAARADGEFQRAAESGTLQYSYPNVHSVADLFPPGH